ncbi:MAG: glucose-6-phosphate isomerase [Lachnospirales bacterium]
MKIKVDYNNMLTKFVGEHGLREEDITNIKNVALKGHNNILDMRKANKLEWMDLPYTQDEIVTDIIEYVNEVKNDFDAFVVLGIGGSALGPLSVQQAINHPFYNELPKEKRKGFPKLYILDNVDPEKLLGLFEIIDVEKCLFNVISKSGSTSETMSQYMIIREMLLKKLGEGNFTKNIVCTTDKENGNLIKIAKEEGYKTFYVPGGVGGRFSELSPVGLLPAAFCGIDIKEMLEGAKVMDILCKDEDYYKNPAYMFAILSFLAMKKGKNITVVMPYADSLKYISDWFAQLWAESLGKRVDKNGNEVFAGQTPVKALGATDQHSQVQLYAEGPFDKMIVLLGVDEYKGELEIPKTYQNIPSLGFLGGNTQNKLIKVEQDATEYALMKAGKMNMTITLPKVNENTLGQLLYMFEVATAFCGELLNIDAFNQPGVEEGKNATYAMLDRPGYEEKKEELLSKPSKENKFII